MACVLTSFTKAEVDGKVPMLGNVNFVRMGKIATLLTMGLFLISVKQLLSIALAL